MTLRKPRAAGVQLFDVREAGGHAFLDGRLHAAGRA
jgi:hypothetical protein